MESRTAAQEAIEAGLVTVDGAPARKAATQVDPAQGVSLLEPPRRYVSRGGDKLAHALSSFALDVTGRRCLDAGASTGGFTDCLLQHGAAHVLAYDVGYGQLHPRLRDDPRVSVFERTNIREVTPEQISPPPPDLLVCDVSFIGLSIVLPVLRRLAREDADAVVLVKPQFEASREEVGKGGVVRDPAVWRRTVTEVVDLAASLGWGSFDVAASPLPGPAGNLEFLVRLAPGEADDGRARGDRIAAAVAEAVRIRDGDAPPGGRAHR